MSTSPKFVFIPIGSSGDVHPFVGIATAMNRRGHDVTVVTAEQFGPMIERSGLHFIPHQSEEQLNEILSHPDIWHPRKGTYLVLQAIATHLREAYDLVCDICDPEDTVLVSHTLAFAARVYQDKHRVRNAVLHLQPSAIRSIVHSATYTPGLDAGWLPQWWNRFFWLVVDRLLVDRHVVPTLNELRRDLDMPPVSRVFKDFIHSPQCTIGLFPKWFATPQPDWPPSVRVTGFPLFDETDHHELSPELDAFLNAGDPPIVFTPGTAHTQAEKFFAAAAAAASKLGRRAILLTKFREQLPADLPDGVRYESYVPFSILLPRCAAIVHHGGVGTCAQGLAAGIPQLTMPMGFDQPDNVTRLYRLGVSRWVMPRRFTGDRVARALDRLLDNPQVAESCRRWRDEIAASDPVRETCELLETQADGQRR